MIKDIVICSLILIIAVLLVYIDYLIKQNNDKEEQIHKLEEQLFYLRNQPVRFEVTKSNIKELESSFTIHFEDINMVSESYIKSVLADAFKNKLRDDIEIICEDDYMRRLKTYRARIKIVEVNK